MPTTAAGRIAESGQVNGKLLDELLADPYYRRKPPKSAGREQYGAEFVARLTRTGLPAADLIATATGADRGHHRDGDRRYARGAS